MASRPRSCSAADRCRRRSSNDLRGAAGACVKSGRARSDGRSMHSDGISSAGDFREADFRRGERDVRRQRRRFVWRRRLRSAWRARRNQSGESVGNFLTCRAAAPRGMNIVSGGDISSTTCAPSDCTVGYMPSIGIVGTCSTNVADPLGFLEARDSLSDENHRERIEQNRGRVEELAESEFDAPRD